MTDHLMDDLTDTRKRVRLTPALCEETRRQNMSNIVETLDQRGQHYGDYGNMAYVAQKIKDVLRDGGAWLRVTPVHRESLDLMATKMARIVCGDPNLPDNWHDIQGYAKLAEDRCPPPGGAAVASATP